MRRSDRETYIAERERAIVTLYNTVRRLRGVVDKMGEYAGYPDSEDAAIVQTYAQAQLALLQLMKEESEE
mgnify:CR=1 FL=1